jgi:hypothetical protein
MSFSGLTGAVGGLFNCDCFAQVAQLLVAETSPKRHQ